MTSVAIVLVDAPVTGRTDVFGIVICVGVLVYVGWMVAAAATHPRHRTSGQKKTVDLFGIDPWEGSGQ